jgi:hypothetical protein
MRLAMPGRGSSSSRLRSAWWRWLVTAVVAAVAPASASGQVRAAIVRVEIGGDLSDDARDAIAGALAAGLMPMSSRVLLPGDEAVDAEGPAGGEQGPLVEAGRRAGAQAVVLASVDQREQHYVVRVELLLASDGSRLATTTLECAACTWDEALATVTRASQGVGSAMPGVLTVRAAPPGVAVTVDDAPVPAASPLALRPGIHRVVAQLAGHTSAEQDVTIVAGGSSEVSLTLTPVRPTSRESAPSRRQRVWAWITAAAAIGSLVPGVAWLALDGECPLDWDAGAGVCPEVYDLWPQGLAAMIIGTGLLSASLGLFVVGYRRPRERAALSIAPWPSRSTVGLAVTF